MKSLSIIVTIICLTFFQSIVMAQSKIKKDPTKQRKVLLDSLSRHSIPIAQINKKYKYNLRFSSFDSKRNAQKIILNNGDTIRYLTTNDKKIRESLSKLDSISAVDFLISLSGIEGSITFPHHPSSWVKREDIPELLRLAMVDVVTPKINQYVSFNYEKNPKRDISYVKTPMAINALSLIYSYISGQFPAAGSLTPTYESVKAWYDSGKSREEYKLVLFTPVIMDMKFPVDKPLNKD